MAIQAQRHARQGDDAQPDAIIVLLGAGADAKTKDLRGRTAVDYAHDNEKLKDSDAYRELRQASQ